MMCYGIGSIYSFAMICSFGQREKAILCYAIQREGMLRICNLVTGARLIPYDYNNDVITDFYFARLGGITCHSVVAFLFDSGRACVSVLSSSKRDDDDTFRSKRDEVPLGYVLTELAVTSFVRDLGLKAGLLPGIAGATLR